MVSKGDIILLSNNSIYSKIIKKVSNSFFTHCGISIGNNKILHLRINGIIISDLTELIKKSKGHYIIKTRKSDINEKQLSGIKYSAVKFIGFFLLYSCNRVFKNLKINTITSALCEKINTPCNTKHMLCTELIFIFHPYLKEIIVPNEWNKNLSKKSRITYTSAQCIYDSLHLRNHKTRNGNTHDKKNTTYYTTTHHNDCGSTKKEKQIRKR